MSKLLDYLNHLDSNATAIAAHNADPAAYMTQFGLNANEQQTFMSGDKAAIAVLAGIDPGDLPKIQVMNVDETF
ncbi:hypothetical protein HZ993_06945 [Rhodoferax sp. AJA081-3]|uniref:hypothetical protein n=1 Tax=Rhodoferax sp. AJA081-3 TaxID=2752316 RepID=UPI001ADF6510|nr:hypothetical protein [Rhodoferax sp. AJA081-3]QTN29548.1 hypothetical protein HZ993_06945 [Rhodoferax sp. AJA081-3]